MTENTSFPTIGILGGGQLAQMLALDGYPLGFRFVFFEAFLALKVAPLVVSAVV